MKPSASEGKLPVKQPAARRARIWAGVSFAVAFFYIPILALSNWNMPTVTPSGLGITAYHDDSPMQPVVIALVVSATLWGAVQEGPVLRHVQWLIGVVSAWGTWFWVNFDLGIRTDQTYFDCAYKDCWPVGYQEWVLVVPIMLASLATIALGAVGPRVSLTVRRVVPIAVFVTLYILVWLIWYPLALPIFNSPPPIWPS